MMISQLSASRPYQFGAIHTLTQRLLQTIKSRIWPKLSIESEKVDRLTVYTCPLSLIIDVTQARSGVSNKNRQCLGSRHVCYPMPICWGTDRSAPQRQFAGEPTRRLLRHCRFCRWGADRSVTQQIHWRWVADMSAP